MTQERALGAFCEDLASFADLPVEISASLAEMERLDREFAQDADLLGQAKQEELAEDVRMLAGQVETARGQLEALGHWPKGGLEVPGLDRTIADIGPVCGA